MSSSRARFSKFVFVSPKIEENPQNRVKIKVFGTFIKIWPLDFLVNQQKHEGKYGEEIGMTRYPGVNDRI